MVRGFEQHISDANEPLTDLVNHIEISRRPTTAEHDRAGVRTGFVTTPSTVSASTANDANPFRQE